MAIDFLTADTTGKKYSSDQMFSFYYGLISNRFSELMNKEFKEKVPNRRERVRTINLDKEKADMYIFNENVLNTVLFPGAFHFPTKCTLLRYYINEAKGTVTLKLSIPYGTKKEEFAVTVKTTSYDYFVEDIGKRLCILKLICRTNRQYHELVEMAAYRSMDTYIKNLDRLIEVITGSSRNMVDDIPVEIQLPKSKVKKEEKPIQINVKLF